LAFNGVSDEIKGLRPIVWKLLLNYLPLETNKWESHMNDSKKMYDEWKDELIIKPSIAKSELEKEDKKKLMDHPLSVNHNS